MESPERIWQLMAKMLNNEASSPEKDELFAFMRDDQLLQQRYELLSRIWKEKGDYSNDQEDVRQNITRIIRRAEADQEFIFTKRKRRLRFTVAASIMFLLVAAWLFFFLRSPDNDILIAKNGSRTHSILPDGTAVWLNAGSRLFIQNDFSGTTREVRLEGEAFFDVVKNTERPFIVHASEIDIKVMGTIFNVKAYPEDKIVETTLLHGLVQVVDRQDPGKMPIELKPNEKLVLTGKAASNSVKLSERDKPAVIKPLPRFTITRIDSTKKENERLETAWVYSRLEFRGDSFEELALKMQRWYNVTIEFTDENVKQLRFNGSFEKETAEQAFAALKEANSFIYQINKYEISVGSSR